MGLASLESSRESCLWTQRGKYQGKEANRDKAIFKQKIKQ